MGLFVRFGIVLALFSASAPVALADQACPGAEQGRTTTHHSAVIGGQTIEYDATLGFMQVPSSDHAAQGCIFFTSYRATRTTDLSRRPVIFAFNGGPGSASLWLHLGLLGPRRVDMGPEGMTAFVPPHLIDNEQSMLDVADVVLIDPISTGFSGAASGPNDPFFGVKNDYRSVAEFIRSYLNEFGRWSSPKFLMGESYGGIRASLLAHYLQSNTQMGVSLNGVLLISPALTFTALNFGDPDNDLPYILYLPSMAATAWYHGRLSSDLQAMTVAQVFSLAQSFAEGAYLDTLIKGAEASPTEYLETARQLSRFTGLPQIQIENLDLRIRDTDFFGGLFQDTSRVVGRLDSRFSSGRLPIETGQTADDPSMTLALGTYTGAINQYLREELGYRTVSPYLTFGNITSWSFDSDAAEFGVMPDLTHALIENPSFRVYVASGYYDLACPMSTVLYDLRHLPARQNLAQRVKISRFESGHMVYIQEASLRRLKAEMSEFIQGR